MKRLIYTYALIKSFYDRGDDFIDSFSPFVIKSLPIDKPESLNYIQKQLRDNFDLKMPLHVIRTILKRAQKRDYVKKDMKKYYKLTENGYKYLDTLETERDVDRRINALLEDIRQFFEKRELSLSLEQIRYLLLSFIKENIESLISFINPHSTNIELPIPSSQEYEFILIEYIKEIEGQKPDNYKTFQDLILGSLISVVIYVQEPTEIAEIQTRKFKTCQVFLDTNFVFSILELHAKEFNEPAKELFDLLKKFNFNVKVFDFTVNEICRVIGGYLKEFYRYPSNLHIDTIYSSLKRKGWTKTDAKEFIINIEEILTEKGITIEWTDVDLDNYKPKNEGVANIINRWKAFKPLPSRNHDLATIEKIKEIRGHLVRKIEDSKAFFLTSDIVLSRLNFIEMGHKENGTISEVILDRMLANILWLKDPRANPPIKSIIAVHSRDLFIKRTIWDRFY